MNIVLLLFYWLRGLLLARSALAAENLALRHQLAVLRRSVRRLRLRPWDRLFWAWLSRRWGGWRDALLIVAPATVVGWHRQGFRLWWRWKSRGNYFLLTARTLCVLGAARPWPSGAGSRACLG